MLELAISTRARTCHTCEGAIPKGTVHIEARGGPATNFAGKRNGWVHFHHIECTKSTCAATVVARCLQQYTTQERRRIRERDAARSTRGRQQRRSRKRPWRT